MTNEKIEKLKIKQAQIKARLQREQARMNTEKRKNETRLKIVLGAVVMNLLLKDEKLKAYLKRRVDKLPSEKPQQKKDKALLLDNFFKN